MTAPLTHPATYADLEAVPEHLVAEILFGHLVTHPRPAPRHVQAASWLGGELINPFQKGRGGPGGWRIYDEPGVHLGPHVVVPALAGWRLERMPQLPTTAWFDLSPDWVCEILSPSTEQADRGDKRRIYATYGVQHLWLVAPDTQMLDVFERQNERTWLLTHTFTGDEALCAPPFTELTFSLGGLWPANPAQPGSSDPTT